MGAREQMQSAGTEESHGRACGHSLTDERADQDELSRDDVERDAAGDEGEEAARQGDDGGGDLRMTPQAAREELPVEGLEGESEDHPEDDPDPKRRRNPRRRDEREDEDDPEGDMTATLRLGGEPGWR